MLMRRIIPCFDVDRGRVVKGVSFVELRDAGDPVELARLYDREGADELVFLDITASSDDRSTVYDMVAATADHLDHAHAEILIDNHDFAPRDESVVHKDVNRLAGEPVELDHGARTEAQDLRHLKLRPAEFDGHVHLQPGE